MSNDGFFGDMPYLATMPSCVFYSRANVAGTTIRDWSPQKATLTNTGSVTNSTGVTPKFSPASLHFSGTPSYLTGSSSARMTPTNGYAYLVSLWVYTASWSGTQILLGTRSGDTSSTIKWCIYGSSGNLAVQIYNSGNSIWLQNTAISALPTSTFVNIILAISAANVTTAYINGTSYSLGTGSGQIQGSGSALNIGYAPGSSASALTGNMDEIAIWDGVLGVVPTVSDIYKSGIGQTRRLIVG
jgi:hypothetical protein